MLHPIYNNDIDESSSSVKGSSKTTQSVKVFDRMETHAADDTHGASKKADQVDRSSATSVCGSSGKENASPKSHLDSTRLCAISDSSIGKSIDPTNLALQLLAGSKSYDQCPQKDTQANKIDGNVTDQRTPTSSVTTESSSSELGKSPSPKCQMTKTQYDKNESESLDPTKLALKLLATSQSVDEEITKDMSSADGDVTKHNRISKTTSKLLCDDASHEGQILAKHGNLSVDELPCPEKVISGPSDPESIVAQILATSGIGSGKVNPGKTTPLLDENQPSVFPETDLATRLSANKAFIEKSRTIAENVVLGPSTSTSVSEEPIDDSVIISQPSETDGDKSDTDLLCGNPKNYLATASAVASRLLMKTGLANIQEQSSPAATSSSSGSENLEKTDSTQKTSEESGSSQQPSSCSIKDTIKELGHEAQGEMSNSSGNEVVRKDNRQDTEQCNIGKEQDSDDANKQLSSQGVGRSEPDSSSKIHESRMSSSSLGSKTTPTKESDSQGESGSSSILEVLSHIAGLAGTDLCIDSTSSTIINSDSVTSTTVSVTTSEPAYSSVHINDVNPPSDHVPVTSNISFDYSIANLIGNENSELSTSHSTENSAKEVSEDLASHSDRGNEDQTLPNQSGGKPYAIGNEKDSPKPALSLPGVVNQPSVSNPSTERPASSPHTMNQAHPSVCSTNPSASSSSVISNASSAVSSGTTSVCLSVTNSNPLPRDCSTAVPTYSSMPLNNMNSIPPRISPTVGQTFSSATANRTHSPVTSTEAQTTAPLSAYQPTVTQDRAATNYHAFDSSSRVLSQASSSETISTPRDTHGYGNIHFPSQNEPSPPLTSGMISLNSLMDNTNTLHHSIGNSMATDRSGFRSQTSSSCSVVPQNSFNRALQYNPEQSHLPSSCGYQMPRELTLQEILNDTSSSGFERSGTQCTNSASFINSSTAHLNPTSSQSGYPQNMGSHSHMTLQNPNTQTQQWTSTVSTGDMRRLPVSLPQASSQASTLVNHFPAQRHSIGMQQDVNQQPSNYQRQQFQNTGNMYHWRGPLGMGMQGREAYGQFHEFQVRPYSRTNIPDLHTNMPPNVNILSSLAQTGQQVNMGQQDRLSAAQDLQSADYSINMELTRFAMQDMQRQQMQASANTTQIPPRHNVQQQPAQPQNRRIPLVCLANRGSQSQVQSSYTSGMQPQRPNYTQTNQIGNNRHQSVRCPPQQNSMPPRARVPDMASHFRQQLRGQAPRFITPNSQPRSQQTRIPNASIRASSTTLPNIPRAPFSRPQTAKRMPVPRQQPQPTRPPVTPQNLQNTSKAPQSVISSAEKTQVSSKSSSSGTPTTTTNTEGSSLAELVVQSILKGHDTSHVEQLLRKSPAKASDSASPNSETSACQQRRASPVAAANQPQQVKVSPSNTPATSQTQSHEAAVRRATTPAEPTASASASASTSETVSTKKRTGRSRSNEPMFVDLTEDDESIIKDTPLDQLNKRPKRDFLDIHILIEVVNVKGHLSQFCLLERCLWGICQPKHLSRCKLTHGWWVYQSEKRQPCPRNEDVAYIAAQIIARSQYDKPYFREQMTAVLNSTMGKRSPIFKTISTEKVHVIGRSFMRPRPEAGLLYINVLKDINTNTTTSEYLKMTTSEDLKSEIKKLTHKKSSSASDPKVLVIAPLSDSTPEVFAEPEQPASAPQRPLSAEEMFNLENRTPIVIEPPPTPAPHFLHQDDDEMQMRNPLVITPVGPPMPTAPHQGQPQSPNVMQPQVPQVSVDNMLRQTPIVIAPPPTPRPAPSPEPQSRPAVGTSFPSNGGPSSTNLQSSQPAVTPPTRMQQPNVTPQQRPTGQPMVTPQQRPTGQPMVTPQQRPTGQPMVTPQQRPTGQPTVTPQQKPTGQPMVNPQQRPTGQPMVNPQQRPTGQPMVTPQQRPTGQPMVTPQQRPTGPPMGPSLSALQQFANQNIMNFLSQQGAPPLYVAGHPQTLQQFPNAVTVSGTQLPLMPVLQSHLPVLNPTFNIHPNSYGQMLNQQVFTPSTVPGHIVPRLPLQPGVVPQPTQLQMEQPSQIRCVQNQLPPKTNDGGTKNTGPTSGTATPKLKKQTQPQDKATPPSSEQSQSSNQQCPSQPSETAPNSTHNDEYISLEDFMDLSCDPGRDKCSSVNSSSDNDAQTHHRVQDHLRALLFDQTSHFQEEETDHGLLRLTIKLRRLEDEYKSVGLRRVTNSRYRILESSQLSKPKRNVQRKFNLESGPALLDDEQLDPEWEPAGAQEEEDYEEDQEDASSSGTASYLDDSGDSDFAEERRTQRRKKVKRMRDLSSDEESVNDYDVHCDSGDEGSRPKRAKRKKIVSDESEEDSPVKKKKKSNYKAVNAIDSDDELPELVPYQKADPVFPPSPSHSPHHNESPPKPTEPSPNAPHRPLKLPKAVAAAINERAFSLSSEISQNVDALRKICPSLQPVVLLKRLGKKQIQRWTGRKSGKSSSKKKHFKKKSKVPSAAPAAPGDTPEQVVVPPNMEYDLEFFTNDQLWRELERRQKFSSCVCGMTFIDAKFYSLHHDMHDKQNPKKCAICSQEFPDWMKFISHTYTTHKTM